MRVSFALNLCHCVGMQGWWEMSLGSLYSPGLVNEDKKCELEGQARLGRIRGRAAIGSLSHFRKISLAAIKRVDWRDQTFSL